MKSYVGIARTKFTRLQILLYVNTAIDLKTSKRYKSFINVCNHILLCHFQDFQKVVVLKAENCQLRRWLYCWQSIDMSLGIQTMCP